jgi:hypothetical protein
MSWGGSSFMATTRRELAVWNVVVVERNTTIQKKQEREPEGTTPLSEIHNVA